MAAQDLGIRQAVTGQVDPMVNLKLVGKALDVCRAMSLCGP